jgi:hypothetical protein
LSQPHWKGHPELVQALIKKGKVDQWIARDVLSQPHWKDHPEFVSALIKKGTVDDEIARSVLSQPHWKDHPVLRKAVGGVEPTVHNLRAAFKRGVTLNSNKTTFCAGLFGKLKNLVFH